MYTEDTFDQPLPLAVVDERVYENPQGQPRPTGFYPNVRGSIPTGWIGTNQVFDDMYPEMAVPGSLNWTEDVNQHVYLHVSATWTPPKFPVRNTGESDPLTDGPPRPDLNDLALFFSQEQGSSQTRHLDAPGVQFTDVGVQDGVTWTYAQSARLGLEPYNPGPDSGGQMPDTLRAIPPSATRGWTEQALGNPSAVEIQKSLDLTQQQSPRQDWLANSTFAGQSFGALTRHVTGGNTPTTTEVLQRTDRRG